MVVNHNEGTGNQRPVLCRTNNKSWSNNSYSDENSNCFQFSKTDFWPVSFSSVFLNVMLISIKWITKIWLIVRRGSFAAIEKKKNTGLLLKINCMFSCSFAKAWQKTLSLSGSQFPLCQTRCWNLWWLVSCFISVSQLFWNEYCIFSTQARHNDASETGGGENSS